MNLLKKVIHPSVTNLEGTYFNRVSARGVLIKDGKILLMYTKRYNDYSFPGGGVDPNEDLTEGLKRELLEETGASGIKILKEIGYIEDIRPHYKPQYDFIHEKSYFFLCSVDEFKDAQLEDYEIRNGMDHIWMNIDDALAHNHNLISEKPSNLGITVYRETAMLEILKETI